MWATVVPDDTVWQFDENGGFERTYDVGHFPQMSAWFGGGLWVGAEGKLTRIDGATNAMTDYPIVVDPAALEPGNGRAVRHTDKSPPKLRRPANKQASFLLAEDWLDDTDPPTPSRPPTARSSSMRRAPSSSTTRMRPGRVARGSGPTPPRRCRR